MRLAQSQRRTNLHWNKRGLAMRAETIEKLRGLESCHGCVHLREQISTTYIFVYEEKDTLLDAKREYQRYLGVSI